MIHFEYDVILGSIYYFTDENSLKKPEKVKPQLNLDKKKYDFTHYNRKKCTNRKVI